MIIEFVVTSGRIIALEGSGPYVRKDVSGKAIWAVAQWLEAHYDGTPYEISSDGKTFRMTVEDVSRMTQQDSSIQLDQDGQYRLAMMTCPYYQYTAGNAEMGTCRNGCWEEPQCVTNGPFENPPGWTTEMLVAEADRRRREEPGP